MKKLEGFKIPVRAGLLALVLTTAGCGGTSVTFGGQGYATPDEAIGAAREACASALGGLESLDQPVVKELRLVLPTNPTVTNNGLVRNGRPPQWMVEYLGTILILEVDCVRSAIQKRNIAESITIIYSPDANHAEPIGDVPVVYLYLPDHASAFWYFSSAAVRGQPLGWNPEITDPSERYAVFLAGIERLVAVTG